MMMNCFGQYTTRLSYTSTDRKKIMHANITLRGIINHLWTGSSDGPMYRFKPYLYEYVETYAVYTNVNSYGKAIVYAMVEIKPLYAKDNAPYHMMVNIETGEMLPILE